jgi:hypothetical protein
MVIRVELGMNLAGRVIEWETDHECGEFVLTIDREELHTPGGNLISSANYELVERIKSELRLHASVTDRVSTLWMYCTAKEQSDRIKDLSRPATIRRMLANDPTLFESEADSYSYTAFHGFVGGDDLFLGGLPATGDREAFIAAMNSDDLRRFDSLEEKVALTLGDFNHAQLVVVATAQRTHGSLLYGMLLAQKLTDSLDYANAITASRKQIPWIYPNAKLEDYKASIYEISFEAESMLKFLHLWPQT